MKKQITFEQLKKLVRESSSMDDLRDIMNMLRKDKQVQTIITGIVGERLMWRAVNFFDDYSDSTYKQISSEVDMQLKYDEDLRGDVCRLYQAIQEKMNAQQAPVQEAEGDDMVKRLSDWMEGDFRTKDFTDDEQDALLAFIKKATGEKSWDPKLTGADYDKHLFAWCKEVGKHLTDAAGNQVVEQGNA